MILKKLDEPNMVHGYRYQKRIGTHNHKRQAGIRILRTNTSQKWFTTNATEIGAGGSTTVSGSTIGEAATDIVTLIGSIAETTVPSAVSDGDAVAIWVDEYGRPVLKGFNTSVDALDVNVVNHALLSRLGPITNLSAVGAVGAGTAVDVSNYNKHTVHIVATGVVSGATVDVDHSLNGTNWVNISSTSVATSGNTEIAISDVAYRYLRTNIPTYMDGTYSTYIYSGN